VPGKEPLLSIHRNALGPVNTCQGAQRARVEELASSANCQCAVGTSCEKSLARNLDPRVFNRVTALLGAMNQAELGGRMGRWTAPRSVSGRSCRRKVSIPELLFAEGDRMEWVFDQSSIDWAELSNLYRVAPLGDKKPDELKLAFSNSMYKCFVMERGNLVGAGRAVADGIDCSYLCDIAVHPAVQGRGLGRDITNKLVELSKAHKKIILYANPGKEGFYAKLGFRRMLTAMAIFKDHQRAIRTGLVEGGGAES
jgi:ribosomal protein S18 acetylase RimI-like enzyme